MDVIRYRPAEAVKWLSHGAGHLRKEAARQSGSILRREGTRTIQKDLMDAAEVLLGVGKSAIAEIMHVGAAGVEYILHKDRFEVHKGNSMKVYRYKDVMAMKMRGDRLSVQMKAATATIAPPAHIVSARVRVPIGWSRNGIEVPYEMLLDELSARCGIEIESP
ncbi:MAG: hypothetical protein HZC36_14385 [Armatimonadetes bacterium]|nr:hypothetical protein [Armatimonadota bacterium]